MNHLDHLVYAVPDLDTAINDIEQRFGIRPAIGGQHPAFGTQNALLSLGSDSYLEIIGPLSASGKPSAFGIDTLTEPRLVTWAAKSNDLQRNVETAKNCGIDLGKISEGKRQQTDGSILIWQLTDLYTRPEAGLIPFLIDWQNSPHPSQHTPQGCSLIELKIEHPEPARIQSLFECLGIDLAVENGPTPRLIAKLNTPNGVVTL